MIDWAEQLKGEGPDMNACRLIALLDLSNIAERERDPFQRRLRLNEMQEAIQSAKSDIEALAEGLIFLAGGAD